LLSVKHKQARAAKKRRVTSETETTDERVQRLSKDAAEKASSRANETVEKRVLRLTKDATAHTSIRANETVSKSSQRLRQDSTYRAKVRTKAIHLTGSLATKEINEATIQEHFCGIMNARCSSCGSKFFIGEHTSDREGRFQTCCHKGKVKILPLTPLPDEILLLLKGLGEKDEVKNFQDNIRSYNSAFAFVSMGAKVEKPIGNGPYCFIIHGQIYHRAGALHPEGDIPTQFAQIYILDPPQDTEQRLSLLPNAECLSSLMHKLGVLISDVNPFAKSYKMLYQVENEALEVCGQNSILSSTIMMAIRDDRKSDPRRYNSPIVTEVAVIFQNSDGEPPLERYLLIHLRSDLNDLTMCKTK